MSRIKIVNKTGISNDTEITLDGKRLPGVTAVEIKPITTKGNTVEAILSFEFVELDIIAETKDVPPSE